MVLWKGIKLEVGTTLFVAKLHCETLNGDLWKPIILLCAFSIEIPFYLFNEKGADPTGWSKVIFGTIESFNNNRLIKMMRVSFISLTIFCRFDNCSKDGIKQETQTKLFVCRLHCLALKDHLCSLLFLVQLKVLWWEFHLSLWQFFADLLLFQRWRKKAGATFIQSWLTPNFFRVSHIAKGSWKICNFVQEIAIRKEMQNFNNEMY